MFILLVNSCSNNTKCNKDIIQLYSNVEYTNNTIKLNNKRFYKYLSNAKINDLRATSIYEASLEVQKASNDLKLLIKRLKIGIIKQLDKKINKIDSIDNIILENIILKDDINITNEYFLKDNNGSELKKGLIEYRNKLINIIKGNKIYLHNKPEIIEELGGLGINTNDINGKTWEDNNFNNKSIAMIFTKLSFIENIVINAEFAIITKLLSGIGNNEWRFYTIEPMIIPVSTHINKGKTYTADLILNKYYDRNIEILIGEGYNNETGQLTGIIDTVNVENGVGKLKIKAESVGLKRFSAIIIQKNYYSGEVNKYPVKVNGSYDIEFWVVDD